ncbi:MAG: citramalate synthase [Desulfobacteraceae bacterium]|nr:citramalate synthase [Desulfobacteraceae bacterium]MBC2719626.1 citramalate synthase [Desulfobacteraceae bacterium]
MEPILLYDTTLRDGAQGENINFSAEEMIKIAQRLDDLGIHYIEGGWPGSNPRDERFFELAKNIKFQNARLTAFGSTRRPKISADEDQNLKALIKTSTPAVTIFGKTWDLHVKQVMNNTLQENLAMIKDSVSFLKKNGREVIYDAEHFFDGYLANREYALQTLIAAIDGGAETVVPCDTNGGTLPDDIATIMNDVYNTLNKYREKTNSPPIKIGIHTHNDSGLAVANSIAAVSQGAVMVQGTINGYGERCGNADLTSIIPILSVKMNRQCISKENLAKLKNISRFVSESANMTPLNSRPFVGKSAFAHKGGIHVSAIMKVPKAYEHMNPEIVGNERRVLISDLAGKSNVEYKAKELGIELGTNGFDSRKIVLELKRMEEKGYQFEVADASFKILMEKLTKQFKPLFELKSFRVHIEKEKDCPCSAHATIKISVDGTEEITAAEGNGPVGALDNALRKALEKFYVADLGSMHLIDYKVRVIDAWEGTAAKVRVLIESRDEDRIWSTIGVSEDIIEASWQALADSFQHKLSRAKS